MNNIDKVFVEKEFIDDSLRVRGFADLIIKLDNGEFHLYDIKSANAWAYKMRVGRKGTPSKHQQMQVATYGLMMENDPEIGRVDSLNIIYYNKDNSSIKIVSQSKEDTMLSAFTYWDAINREHLDGLPQLEKGVAPVEEWECRYCSFRTICEKDKEKE